MDLTGMEELLSNSHGHAVPLSFDINGVETLKEKIRYTQHDFL